MHNYILIIFLKDELLKIFKIYYERVCLKQIMV